MPRHFSENEWVAIADYVKEETRRREQSEVRKEKERIWNEVDRQIAMDPVPRKLGTGDESDWFPNTELPWQFNALEVIAADARSLKFPRTMDWYRVHANVSRAYQQRWDNRRGAQPGDEAGAPVPQPGERVTEFRPRAELVEGGGLMLLTQETADVLAKATLDHFHSLYDFRQQVNLLDASAIKYGTFVARVRPVKLAKFSSHYRGVDDSLIGPATIPCDIKNTYLDDSPVALWHEGISAAPSIIRRTQMRLEDMLAAARTGGKDRGWILDQVAKIESQSDPDGRNNQIELLEMEGDLYVPMAAPEDTIILENVIVTVAERSGVARPIRFQEAPTPFRSYVVGHYMRDDINSPYGSSPLMKGAPVQEAGTLVFNTMMAVAALSGQPPLAYDRNDPSLAGTGGPQWYPGATFPTDAPNSIEKLDVGDMGELRETFIGLLKHYEDLTGVNDPRRGAPVRSHTTRGAVELEASRGIARTDDFVSDQEKGAITSILYMEYAIAKQVMTKQMPVFVNEGGIEGWVKLASPDLADEVNFFVEGSAGPSTERERAENFIGASRAVIDMAAAAAQLGQQLNVRFEEIVKEVYKRAGENNPARFIGEAAELPQPAQARPNIPGTGRQVSPVPPQAMAPAGGRRPG